MTDLAVPEPTGIYDATMDDGAAIRRLAFFQDDLSGAKVRLVTALPGVAR